MFSKSEMKGAGDGKQMLFRFINLFCKLFLGCAGQEKH
jgi:hypothetical protein